TWDQQAWYGWNIDPNLINTSLIPGYPAEAAGLKIGDRVDWASMPLAARADATLEEYAVVDPPVTLTVFSDGKSRTITMRGKTTPLSFNLANAVSVVGDCIVGLIGVVLVLLRPTRMTWGFLLALLYGAVPLVIM